MAIEKDFPDFVGNGLGYGLQLLLAKPYFSEAEPGLLTLTMRVMGLPMHVHLYRIETADGSTQEPHASLTEERKAELIDLWVAIDGGGGGAWNLHELPDREGLWWLVIFPHHR